MALLVHTCLYPHEDYLRALCPALNGVLWLRGYEREALTPDPILLLLQRETFPPSEIKYKSSLCRSNVMFCTSRDLNLWCLTGYSFKCSAVLQLFKNTLIPWPIFFFFFPSPTMAHSTPVADNSDLSPSPSWSQRHLLYLGRFASRMTLSLDPQLNSVFICDPVCSK